MKLNDALEDILGKGMPATIHARTGLVGAVAAGLAAIEFGDASKPSARAFASWVDRRLHEPSPRRHVTALDAEIGASSGMTARRGGMIERFRPAGAASASNQAGSVASS